MRMRGRALLSAIFVALTLACSTAPPPAVPSVAAKMPGYVHQESGNRRVIIFVHGVIGDGRSTWTDAHHHTYFPELVAGDPAFEDADVWVYDFPSPMFGMSYDIDEVAVDLKRRLTADDVLKTHEQFVFVAHSMGGLVVRAFLLQNQKLLGERVPMIYFFATPTIGSGLANIGTLISSNPQIANMRKLRTADPGVLGIYANHWAGSPFHQRTRSYCAYERERTFGMYVVERASASHLCTAVPDPILKDHIEIVKPSGTDDVSYVAFRNAYRETFSAPVAGKRAVFNLRRTGLPFLQISNITVNQNCSLCWSDSVVTAADDQLAINVRYRNDSDHTVRGVRLRLTVPERPRAAGTITATLSADEAEAVHGEAGFKVIGAPVVLVPEDGRRFQHRTRVPLPYEQKGKDAFSPEGLLLGDVEPGEVFLTDVVLELRAIRAPMITIDNLDEALQPFEKDIERGEDIDLRDFARDLSFSGGRFDRMPNGGPVTWVPIVPARDIGRPLTFTAILYNTTGTTLRDVIVYAVKTSDPTGIRVDFYQGPTLLESMRADLPWMTNRGLALGMAELTPLPQDVRRASEVRTRRLSEDPSTGMSLDPIPPRSGVAVSLGYDVVAAADSELHDQPLHIRSAAAPAIPPPSQAKLNERDVPFQVSLAGGAYAWGERLDGLRPGDLVTFAFRCHNGSASTATGVRARVEIGTGDANIVARGRLTADNAPESSGSVQIGFTPGLRQVRLRYKRAFWFENGDYLPIDGRHLETTGLLVGEVAPHTDGWVTAEYVVTSDDPKE